jgi:hypothetical protein
MSLFLVCLHRLADFVLFVRRGAALLAGVFSGNVPLLWLIFQAAQGALLDVTAANDCSAELVGQNRSFVVAVVRVVFRRRERRRRDGKFFGFPSRLLCSGRGIRRVCCSLGATPPGVAVSQQDATASALVGRSRRGRRNGRWNSAGDCRRRCRRRSWLLAIAADDFRQSGLRRSEAGEAGDLHKLGLCYRPLKT